MTIPRLFVDAPLAPGIDVIGRPGQAHYLGNVLRRAAGDPVHLFNGRDGEWAGRIATLRRDPAGFTADRQLRPQQAEPDVWLAFALLKRDATDLVVQKATELGVAALLPIITAHSNTTKANLDRLAAIATEAAEQSERLTRPALHPPQPLAALLAGWPAARRLFVAAERRGVPHLHPASGPAALLVGPEGGFTPAELDDLRIRPFVTLASLGPRILRAETACLAGLALLQAPACG
jgi:16S rRNA (uracil1498-N3)-methyltransferase